MQSSVPIRGAVVEGIELYRRGGLSDSLLPGEIEWIEEDKVVRISFLSSDGLVPIKSGLNWGQRADDKGIQREKSQTYLSIRKTARKIGVSTVFRNLRNYVYSGLFLVSYRSKID